MTRLRGRPRRHARRDAQGARHAAWLRSSSPTSRSSRSARDKAFSRRVALTTAIYAVVLADRLARGQQRDEGDAAGPAGGRPTSGRSTSPRSSASTSTAATRWSSRPSWPSRRTLKGAEREKFEALARKFADEEKRMNADKKEIEPKAKAAEAARDRNQAKDPYFDYAEVLLQIAIVTRLDLDPVRVAPDLRLLARPGRPRRPAVGERLHPARPPAVLPRVLTGVLAARRGRQPPLGCFSGVV